MKTQILSANQQTIGKAAGLLKAGELVAIPTETVYGLAANALDGQAVARIYEAKGRPSFNPLIIHLAHPQQAEHYVVMSEPAKMLAHHFWPGPLTMILPRSKGCEISELASAGLQTLAVRVPNQKTALSLLKECDLPLAAPSANKSGSLSPTSAAHVHDSLGGHIPMILADGASAVGLESTVIDMSSDVPEILRPGAISAEDIAHVLGCNVAYHKSEDTEAPKSPGLLLKHYAPSIPVRLNAIDLEPGEALLAFGNDQFMGIKGGGRASDLSESQRRNLSQEQDLHEAAANLFAFMRALDQPENKGIAVMQIPDIGLGIAINDRLKRAAQS